MSHSETKGETTSTGIQRVIPGCLVEFVRHERTPTRYGGHQMTWRVNHPGHPLHGRYLPQYYPDRRNTSRKRLGWSPRSKFAQQWLAFAGHGPKRWDRLPRTVFKDRTGIAHVVLACPEMPGKPPYYKIISVDPVGGGELCQKPDIGTAESRR